MLAGWVDVEAAAAADEPVASISVEYEYGG